MNYLNSLKISRQQFIVILILVINLFLAYSIVSKNYNLIFFLLSIFIISIILSSNIFVISLILTLIPFSEWAVEQGLLLPQIMWFPELLSGIICLKAIIKKAASKQKINLFGLRIIFAFLVLIFLSFLLNKSGFVSMLLFLRLIIRYYLLFLGIINLDFDEKSMKIINNVLIAVFLLQIPLAVIKLIIYGQGETPLALSAHSVSTYLPLIAIAFIFSYYFFYKKNKLYILILIGFLAFSIIGGKRGFIFFLPILLLYLFWNLIYYIKVPSRVILILLILFLVSLYGAARLIPTLNPERKVGGRFDPYFLINYAYEYTTHTSESGMPTGRISTSIFVFNKLKNRGLTGILFGYGPGSIIKSIFRSYSRREALRRSFEIIYGLSGFNWLAVQAGYISAFLFLFLYFILMKKSISYYKRENDPYWRAFGLGVGGFSFVMLIINFLYSPALKNDAVSAFYFCLAGFIILRNQMSKEIEK